MRNFTKEQIETAINNSKSILEASRLLNTNYKTFRSYAKKYGVFTPNQAGKGIIKSDVSLEDLKRNSCVRKRVIISGLKEERCENCGLGKEWLDKPIILELHHIDGNCSNNTISNLQFLCPNCHSQTENYRNRKRVA